MNLLSCKTQISSKIKIKDLTKSIPIENLYVVRAKVALIKDKRWNFEGGNAS